MTARPRDDIAPEPVWEDLPDDRDLLAVAALDLRTGWDEPEDPIAVAARAKLAELHRREVEVPRIEAAIAASPPPPTLTVVENAPDARADPDFERVPETAAEALDALVGFVTRYVAFPSGHERVAVALWVAHAHIAERCETSPILAITSAEMRSGKTRLLDCLELVVPVPFRAVIPSEAVVYTVLSQRPRPTLLLDEADAIFGRATAEKYEGLRAILNSGNRAGTPVLRVKLDGRRREVEAFDVFGPKVVAGIGDLPDTVADRSIPIRLKRRAPGEVVGRFRRRTASVEAAAVAFDWAAVTVETDGTLVPEELPDRAADSWEPLLAIADAAGGDWPIRARLAAVALSGEEHFHGTTGTRLLADLQDVFLDDEHLTPSEVLRRLCDLDASPWAEWYGKPLTARGLARLLEPYGVHSALRRVDDLPTQRLYFRADFEDPWSRYVGSRGPVPTASSVPEAGPDTDETDGTHAQTPTPGPSSRVACSDYAAHQFRHRLTASGWVCDACGTER